MNTNEETEAVIKGLPTIEGPRPDKFRAEFYQTLKEDVEEILLKLFKNRTRGSTPKQPEGALPNSFCKASVTLIPKLGKYTTQKENYRPNSWS